MVDAPLSARPIAYPGDAIHDATICVVGHRIVLHRTIVPERERSGERRIRGFCLRASIL